MPFSLAKNVTIEVDYMPGAEPGVAPFSGGSNPWTLFQWNVVRMLPQNIVGLSYPRGLADMGMIRAETIPDSPPPGFTDAEILALAEEHRDVPRSKENAHIHVLFLHGVYAESTPGKARPRAAQVQGRRVVAVFGGIGMGASDLEQLSEQLALLHELGHVLGLVDLGVPPQRPHIDDGSPGHCSEPNCAMNTAASVTESMLDYARTPGAEVPILFGAECLTDLAAHYGE